MDFFYPNWTNDMWRVWGLILTGNADHFAVPGEKRFDQARIEDFCHQKGIALYDTAQEVVRLKDNASDNFLQVVRPTDLAALLARIPHCHTVVATGQKAADTLRNEMGFDPLAVGAHAETVYAGRRLTVWRMPSTSRAYPRSVVWKAEYYRQLLPALGM